MIHSTAEVQTRKIGRGTLIWQYSVILRNAQIGCDCNINCHTFIENDVIIGDNVTVKSGVYIWDGLRIENDVFIGPNVTFTNDLYPRSKKRRKSIRTVLGQGASIGANSSVLAGVRIGQYAMVGMGSVVTKDVPDHALVYGCPAEIRGWVDEGGNRLTRADGDIWRSEMGQTFKIVNSKLSKLAP